MTVEVYNPPAYQPGGSGAAGRGTRSGRNAAQGRMIVDGSGPYFPLGTSFFTGFWMRQADPPRWRRWLEYIAPRFHYTRNLGYVGGGGWEDRTVDPLRPGMPDAIKAALDEAWGEFNVRTQVTLFGGSHPEWRRVTDVLLDCIRGREEAVQYLEPVNEAFQNFKDREANREIGRRCRAAFPLVGLSNPDDMTYEKPAWELDISTVGLPHVERGRGDEDWRQVRQGCEFMGIEMPFDNNEPGGFESSVEELRDPLRLACLRAVGVVSGMPGFCFHTGAGVRAGGAADRARGRKADIWEYGDELDRALAAMGAAVSALPADAPNFAKTKGHWQPPLTPHPLPGDVVWSDDAARFDHGIVRTYGGVTGSQFAAVAFGVRRFVVFTAREAWANVRFHDALTGALEKEMPLAAGQQVRVEGDPTGGSNKAYVIIGSR